MGFGLGPGADSEGRLARWPRPPPRSPDRMVTHIESAIQRRRDRSWPSASLTSRPRRRSVLASSNRPSCMNERRPDRPSSSSSCGDGGCPSNSASASSSSARPSPWPAHRPARTSAVHCSATARCWSVSCRCSESCGPALERRRASPIWPAALEAARSGRPTGPRRRRVRRRPRAPARANHSLSASRAANRSSARRAAATRCTISPVRSARRSPVVGDLCRLDVRLGGQRLRQPGMDPSTLPGHQAPVDRIHEQRVGQRYVVPAAGPEKPSSGERSKCRLDLLGLQAAGLGSAPSAGRPPLGDAEQSRHPPRTLVQVADPPVEQVRQVLTEARRRPGLPASCAV